MITFTWFTIAICVCAACADLYSLVWSIREGDYYKAILMFCLFIIMICGIIINISRL